MRISQALDASISLLFPFFWTGLNCVRAAARRWRCAYFSLGRSYKLGGGVGGANARLSAFLSFERMELAFNAYSIEPAHKLLTPELWPWQQCSQCVFDDWLLFWEWSWGSKLDISWEISLSWGWPTLTLSMLASTLDAKTSEMSRQISRWFLMNINQISIFHSQNSHECCSLCTPRGRSSQWQKDRLTKRGGL